MRTTILFVLISASFAVQAMGTHLEAPRNNDLVVTRMVALPVPAGQFEHKPVSFSWALDPTAAVQPAVPFTSESREYWTQVDAAQMRSGIDIDTTAPGAVLRISPIGKSLPVTTQKLSLSSHGQNIDAGKAFAHIANSDQLQQAGMDVSNGTAVVQFDKGLGQGRFRLQVADASGRYLLHVFEPDSPYALHAGADRANLLAGGQFEVTAVLGKGQIGLAGSEMAGLLVSPSGKSYDLNFSPGKSGAQRALARVPVDAQSESGLWEVQVFAGASDNGVRIQRDSRTAVAVAQPTAKLDGSYRFDSASLNFSAPIQVGSSGRYELRATLFATATDGVARPVSEAHSAAWFDSGTHALTLNFDRAHLPAGYGAPFEVRYLELKDQARMGQLESRELAARQ
jgi:hypothetical protein